MTFSCHLLTVIALTCTSVALGQIESDTPATVNPEAVVTLNPATPNPATPNPAKPNPAKTDGEKPNGEKPNGEKKPAIAAPEEWSRDLAAVRKKAQLNRELLLVVVGAPSCEWCERLGKEIGEQTLQDELANWNRVYVDAVLMPQEAEDLIVTGTPAFRVFSADGRSLGGRDGFSPVDRLAIWLRTIRDEAETPADEALLDESKPSLLTTMRLVRQCEARDPTIREFAVRRLATHRQATGDVVLKMLREGNLAAKLAAIEIFTRWDAPTKGLDPWDPKMPESDRIAALDKWLAEHFEEETGKVLRLDEDAVRQLAVDVERLIAAEDAEVPSMRERIAFYGVAARPLIMQRLQGAQSDRERERLLAVKYRLSAEDNLVLTWPGGIERLSDSDPQVRRRAAEELVAISTAELQPLLLDLFADPDPSVREASLRGLKNSGGKRATEALLTLLDDPEPNVRAAVLKQFAEDATAELATQVAAYSLREKNADLVVHAVRYFQELDKLDSEEVLDALVALGKHESWQVRAESAKTLGKVVKAKSRSYGRDDSELSPKVLASLVGLLTDDDDFVVSRAVEALAEADDATIVEPLVNAARQNSTLRPNILNMIARGSSMGPQAIESIRGFSDDEDPAVRAAVVTGLMHLDIDGTGEGLALWLTDEAPRVRIAAAHAFFTSQESTRGQHLADLDDEVADPGDFGDFEFEEPPRRGIGGFLKGLFAPKEAIKEEVAEEVDAAEADDDGGDDDGGDTDSGDTDSGDTESAEGVPGETWLIEFRAGKGIPTWMPGLEEHFKAMLEAESAAERNAGAMAYLVYGHTEESLPVLLESTKTDPTLIGQTQSALGWLVWSERFVFFDSLYELAVSDDDRYGLVRRIASDNDMRAKDVLWQILGRRTTSQVVANVTVSELQELYFGSSYYYDPDSVTAEQRKVAHTELLGWVERPPALRQLAALSIAFPIAADEVAEQAVTLSRNPALDDKIRGDLFLLSLAASSKSERATAAKASLHDPELPRIAGLSYLVFGDEYLETLPNSGMRLKRDTSYSRSSFHDSENPIASRIIVPESPKAVTLEDVRPLLLEDPLTAAQAGYVSVLLGDDGGMDPLLTYWRSLGDRSKFDRLLYRAIAILDDDTYLPELKDIYLRSSSYEKREFYWTVRIMTGPKLIEFRSQIRDEVGMENLR